MKLRALMAGHNSPLEEATQRAVEELQQIQEAVDTRPDDVLPVAAIMLERPLGRDHLWKDPVLSMSGEMRWLTV